MGIGYSWARVVSFREVWGKEGLDDAWKTLKFVRYGTRMASCKECRYTATYGDWEKARIPRMEYIVFLKDEYGIAAAERMLVWRA